MKTARAPAGARRSTASTRRSAARGATRRSRARRSASTRSAIVHSQWDPKNQRPELWTLYNGKINKGESIRVFPLSNWTELDVWQYIVGREHPHRAALLRRAAAGRRARRRRSSWSTTTACASARRGAARRSGSLPHARLLSAHRRDASRRATTVPRDHPRRCSLARVSERQGRLIDHDEDGSMETKKREGYF